MLIKLKMHMHIHICMNLMQDGATCYRSMVGTNFLMKSKIKALEWPTSSSNLDSIKNYCTEMKDKVAEKQSDAEDQIRLIKVVWAKGLLKQQCKGLTHNMSRHLKEVIKSSRGHIKCRYIIGPYVLSGGP